ncbi:MAG TPA: electron transfer flavoprotein beta subunit/FixA family protein [Candidatus Aminicenantes bacterium]|nr:electron transfer flavoprotein beta subunit/FixA family protein [Candidatus Aminicenantes bacterium]
MNIFVCIKQVPDTEASLSVEGGRKVRESGLKWVVSPYDEYALEAAIQLKENTTGSSVTAITVGPARADGVLRTALAMGATAAVHVESDSELDHHAIAACLAAAIRSCGDPDIILTGKQAIDVDAGVLPLFLAQAMDMPSAGGVLAMEVADGTARVEREIEGGARERIEMALPCVVGATKGLNTPRYPSLMGIMKAKKVEVKKFTPAELNLESLEPVLRLESLSVPEEKAPGRVIEGEPADAVRELVRLLRDEAKVL